MFKFRGSARVPRTGERVLAIADFSSVWSECGDGRTKGEDCFGATPKPARETRALPGDGYTRERRRPALRVYLTGLRFGSILSMPTPLLTSMI